MWGRVLLTRASLLYVGGTPVELALNLQVRLYENPGGLAYGKLVNVVFSTSRVE